MLLTIYVILSFGCKKEGIEDSGTFLTRSIKLNADISVNKKIEYSGEISNRIFVDIINTDGEFLKSTR